MELFLSAEVDGGVSEALHRARTRFKKIVVPKLADDYGPGVERWSVITILRHSIPEGWGEVRKYHRQSHVAEFRLIIDYVEFKAASSEKQVRMLADSILRSVDLFPSLKVEDFDIDRFRRDILDAASSEGWNVHDSI